jgi:hypothetical protein
MKYTAGWTALLAAAILFIAGGCSKDSTAPVTPGTAGDVQALKLAVTTSDSLSDFSASDEESIDDNGMQDSEFDGVLGSTLSKLEPAGVASVSDSIYPVRWGRRIFWDQIVRNYNVVTSGDTLATVQITKTIPGVFLVGWGTRAQGVVTIQDTVRKPFTETVRRNVVFRRIAHMSDARFNWVPVAITMVQGKTDSINNFTITSMEFSDKLFNVDTVITDPLSQWFRLGLFHGSIPRIPVGDSLTVKVTVTSSDSLPEFVNLRHGVGFGSLERRRVKMNLVSTTGGSGNYTRVYQRTIRTGLGRGILAERFNLLMDVVSNGSINSMTAPFSNEYWGAPYIVLR